MPKNLNQKESVKVNYKFWIENTDGRRIGDQQQREKIFESNKMSGWDISEFVSHSELCPPSNFVKNDTIFICCKVYVSKVFWNSIYDQDKQTNGCTVQIDDKEIKISKQLLIDQSDVFKQMFQVELEESKTNTIKLEDITPEALNAFISYSYLDYLDSSAIEHAEELFAFVDKYMIKKLKDECIQVFLKVPTRDNVLPRLALAVMHNLDNVKDYLLTHLLNNESECNWKNVLRSKEMDELREKNKQLADAITTIIYSNVP